NAPLRGNRLARVVRMRSTACVALVLLLAFTPACGRKATTSARAPNETEQTPIAQGTSGTASTQAGQTRTERDLLGEKAVPAAAYYGVQTARALENFQISGIPINHYPGFVEAWAIVKLAAARANTDVGAMKKETLAAIEKATQAVLKGQYNDQFVVD